MKSHPTYICQQCGYHSPTYLGRCPQCDSWNSMVETIDKGVPLRQGSVGQAGGRAEIINLSKIQKTDYKRVSTGLEEFDRVLGGGIVAGSLVLVSGDPGIGKSTLLTQLALNINNLMLDNRNLKLDKEVRSSKIEDPNSNFQHQNLASSIERQASSVLYVAGEESAQQIKIRADRISPNGNLAVLNSTDVDEIVGVVRGDQGDRGNWGLVIIDSIQTLETADLESIAGSVGQVRECAHRLQKLAKSLHIPIFLVGHVTKEGNLAGPKTLEHLVDVVLSLEGESTSNFRVLRSTKNRFGPTDEVGIFEMSEEGMVEVKNPSKLFLDQRVEEAGSVIVSTMNGMRPILVEIQALVSKSFLPMPRRTGSGIDNNRLQLLVAVLQSRMKLPLFDKDIFVNVTGGLKVFEPAADLGICLSIISSFKDKAVKPKTAVAGEVGLLGELRMVRQIKKRETEAKKLGFSNFISSENARSLKEAISLVLG